MELKRIFSLLSLFAISAVTIYFEFWYLPFTTECYYVRGPIIYDNPCLVLSAVLESLGLVVLASLFSNKRVFLATSIPCSGFPLLMGVTRFDRTLAGWSSV
ncbi:hypothetical protein [Thermococcus camini]|uniref:Uncharacterized protein n=1 Tax=Thermococcus camini TaxID=2016373 RepID=A0A7G2DDT0_9EURY|nr:hypothetical protein [Thermococcus camini]CAD5245313.1 conserved protein of unknown function [Thermococcus camini]